MSTVKPSRGLALDGLRIPSGSGVAPRPSEPTLGSFRFLGPVLVATATFVGLYLARLYSYDLFHSLVEIFSVVIACGVFVFAWNSRGLVANGYLLFLGIAYLFVGGVDLTHTLAYEGMSVFAGFDSNLPTQLWIGARYLQALSLLIAPYFLRERFLRSGLSRPGLVFAAYTAVVGAFFASVFYWRVFPACYVEGQGLTPFKIASEYVISALLLVAGYLLWQRRDRLERDVYQLLLASIGVTIVQEIAFTLYTDPYGTANLLGHFLKIVAYYLVYRAIIRTGLVKPFALLLRDLEQANDRLSVASVQAREQAKIAEEHAQRAEKANARLVAASARIEAQAEVARHDAAQLREMEQAREDVLRAITHDLRNPLTSVLGNAQLLMRYADRPETVQRQAAAIAGSARQMNAMLGDLVDSLRIEAGRMTPSLQLVNLSDVLLDLDERMGGDEEHGHVRLELPEDVPAVLADPSMVERVLANLVSNALKYGREGSDVVVRVVLREGEVVVSVVDEGPGIAPEHLPHIFERYYRAERDQQRQGGLGLGLYITKGLVEAMGGRIWVESEAGKGSTFCFTLPQARALEDNR